MSDTAEQRRDYWLDLAEYDLETAAVMLSGERYLYLGFMCHQVVEKTLKAAVWALTGTEPPYTHVLSRLLRASGLEGEIPERLATLIDILEPLNVEARYPTHKEKLLRSLSPERSEKILRQTEELHAWIKAKL